MKRPIKTVVTMPSMTLKGITTELTPGWASLYDDEDEDQLPSIEHKDEGNHEDDCMHHELFVWC